MALRISVSVCSSWPTTTTRDEASSGSAGYSTDSGRHSGTTLTDAIRDWPTPNVPNGGRSTDHAERQGNTLYHNGKKVQEGLESTSRDWQTPNAGLFNSRKQVGAEDRQDLLGGQVEKWKTPHGMAGIDHTGKAGERWPSPMARDHKGGGVMTERKDGKSRMDMLDWRAEAFSRPVLSTLDGSELSPTTRTLRPRLNPAFAAWLMGIPWFWTHPAVTSFARSAMEPYRSALRSQLELLLGERSSGNE